MRHILYLSFLLLSTSILKAQEPTLMIPVRLGDVTPMLTVQNNKYLVLGSHTVFQIWETTNCRLLKSVDLRCDAVAESPDKKTLLVSSEGKILFFDLETFEFKRQEELKIGKYSPSVAYAVNGKTIYAATKDDTYKYVVSINTTNKKIDTLFSTTNGAEGYYTHFKLSADGKWCLVEPYKGDALLVNIETKKLVKTYDKSKGKVYDFSPDNNILEIEKVDYDTYAFRIYNINTATELKSVQVKIPFSIFSKSYILWLDNNRLFLNGDTETAIVDFSTKSIQLGKKFYDEYAQYGTAIPAKVKNGVVKTIYRTVTNPEKRLEELDIANFTKIRDFGNASISPFYMCLAPNDFKFQYGAKKEIRLGKNLRVWSVNSVNAQGGYSPDGTTRLHLSDVNILEKFKSMDKKGDPLATIRNMERSSSGIIYNKAGTVAALIHGDGMFILDVEKMTLRHNIVVGKNGYGLPTADAGCFIENDTKIIACGSFETDKFKTYCVDVATGKILWSVEGFYLNFMPQNDAIVCYDWKEKTLKWLNPQTGAVTKTKKTNHYFREDNKMRVAISPDAKQVIFSDEKSVFFYDIETEKLIPAVANPNTSWLWAMYYFKHKPEFALSLGVDGKVILWNTKEGRALATFYFFAETNDWVCLTPNGLFDGSPEALKKMYYVKGKEIIPLEQLYEKYYTPGLVAQLIGGETPLPIDEDDDIKKLKSPPSVKIKFENQQRNLTVEDDIPTYVATQAQVSLTVEAVSKDDVIDEIRLFQNGKLVGGTTRNLVVEDDKKAAETKVFTINLLEGENRFKAIALNSQRTESAPDEIIITYKPAKTVTQTTNPVNDITLHMVVIGINKYKNPKYNLNYATADATGFKEAIEKGGSSIFSKTNIVFVGDDKATKEGISTELDKIKTASNPKDVFIFYYAGHGVLNEKKDFFLVPHDVVQLYGADDALAQKGLSANVLQQYSKDIKAQKQLFILDACQSAGALDKLVASRGAAEEKAIAQLARATGTHWLTASGSEQFASEFTQLGHGTFTYVLLEALSGKADKGGDKKVTVKEIDAYLQEVVPEVTAKYKGTPQYPASFGFGNDFPIGVVKN